MTLYGMTSTGGAYDPPNRQRHTAFAKLFVLSVEGKVDAVRRPGTIVPALR